SPDGGGDHPCRRAPIRARQGHEEVRGSGERAARAALEVVPRAGEVILYLSVRQLLRLHEIQLRAFGGSAGIRDRGGLEAAAAKPRMTFGGDDLYPDLAAKAAALMHSLVMNHPFVDGNKRVGAMAAELFLAVNGEDIDADDETLVDATLAVARGEVSAEALAIWIRQRSSPRRRGGR